MNFVIMVKIESLVKIRNILKKLKPTEVGIQPV